ncbi:tyrosine-protein phosphatase [Lacticaseibacillus baoqingensis]|uniref:Tyrosine-protein phosphatase n=1 Tax=Lacticaseibacillus baoqingensis TaxID=2486013 RepID=A0ABW4E711_9LACO|nr:tyrosine-protein phosphatase [Lacticaseibacillus baoqingensis]
MTPRILDIHHGFNFRDLGGYVTKAGQTLRTHKLIRSGRLNELSTRDQAYLADYGVKIDVDFRSPQERASAPDKLPAGAAYHFTPVFAVDETKASANAEQLRRQALAKDPLGGFRNMVNTYADMVLQPNAQKAYRAFFDLLLANSAPDSALLFHCSAGKDRTGMGAVYLLTALGVDPVTVRRDYLASNNYLIGESERMVNNVKKAGGSPALIASTRSLGGVANEYLDSALMTINSRFGSLDHYLTDVLGVDAAQRRDLRAIYLK